MSLHPIGIVCPGQGSQHRQMLDPLVGEPGLDRLLDAAEAMSDLELQAILRLGQPDDLADTRIAQPLLFLCDWTWGRRLLDAGLQPVALAGHSLGEIAALALAGVFSVEAGLQLVTERARLMATVAAREPGAMAAVLALDMTQVRDVLSGLSDVWVANDNGPGQVVISGRESAVDEAGSLLLEAGARKVVRLSVSGAFHSPLMEDAAAAFRETLASTEFSDAHLPVIQNARPTELVQDAEIIRTALAEQMTASVGWTDTMETLRAAGARYLLEAGPGSVLKGLAKRMEGVQGLSSESTGLQEILAEVGA